MDSEEAAKGLIDRGSLTIGWEEKLADPKARFSNEPVSEEDKRELHAQWSDFVKEVLIRLGMVLKSQRVSVLLGAGASRAAGGPVLANIPVDVEDGLIDEGFDEDGKVASWLAAFYAACARNGADTPTSSEEIAARI